MNHPINDLNPRPLSSSRSPNSVPAPVRRPRPQLSRSSLSLAFPQSATMQNLGGGGHGKQMRSSRTWTTSSGELGLLSDTDELEDRGVFVQEYNRLAKKHGVRILVVEDFDRTAPSPCSHGPEKRGWFQRILRSSSSNPPPPRPRSQFQPRHKRSVSDLALNFVHSRREPIQELNLQSMVRLSGKSVLYLPQEHSPCSLVLPTCLRATAQYLAQNSTTRGIFRIPGSVKIVNALFDYYCYMEKGGAGIAGTVRCANLPVHIQSSVHDIASTFKRLLSLLPGGILGSLSLFDALVAIHSRLNGDPEFPRTKQTKVRARLIALAIGTISSQFRRELICAVFGLLSLIGRVAEVTPREDESGRPLPTGDLMGYSALGIVFGPLLVGDLLDKYSMRLVTPSAGLLLFPLTPQKLRRERRKLKTTCNESVKLPTVDKIHIANSITEMMIANWRDVVRQMRSLGTHHRKDLSSISIPSSSIRPSVSESFVIRTPQDWADVHRGDTKVSSRDESPDPGTPTTGLKRHRPRSKKSIGSGKLAAKPSITALSPTAEETSAEDEGFRHGGVSMLHLDYINNGDRRNSGLLSGQGHETGGQLQPEISPTAVCGGRDENESRGRTSTQRGEERSESGRNRRRGNTFGSPQVFPEDVPPRTSSKPRHRTGSVEGHGGRPSPNIGDRAAGSSIRSSLESERRRGGRGAQAEEQQPQGGTKQRGPSITRQARQQSKASRSRCPETTGNRAKYLGIEKSRQNSATESPTTDSYGSGRVGLVQSTSDDAQAMVQKDNAKMYDLHSHRDSGMPPSNQKENFVQILHDEQMEPKPIHRPLKETLEDSIDNTPRQFYSAMRVPPSLSGEYAEAPHGSPGQGSTKKGKARPNHQSHDTSRGKPSSSVRERLSQFEPTEGDAERPKLRFLQPRSQTTDPASIHANNARGEMTTANKSGSVRAMAAMFDTDSHTSMSPFSSKVDTRKILKIASGGPQSPPKSIRPSKSQLLRNQPSSTNSGSPERRVQTPNPWADETPKLRTSVSDSVALRAAALLQAEKKHQGGERAPFGNQKSTTPTPKRLEPDRVGMMRSHSPMSLGKMIPPIGQPPVAQHLNLARPTSSASSITQSTELFPLLAPDTPTPTSRPGSTIMLHGQIRNLQRQLDAKIEEAAQLRRQLEVQGDADVGTLSEQLREAKREAQTWKERAESAERRVKVFERFTAKLRGIREAAAIAEGRLGDSAAPEPNDDGPGVGVDDDEDNISPNQHVIFFDGKRAAGRSTEASESDDSGHTEEAGIVTARIRKCLHGNRDRAPESKDNTFGGDGVTSPKKMSKGDIGQSAFEIWTAAEELLEMENGTVV